jgi:hypothetical protein
MAFQTQRIYGYKVSNNLTDVINPELALQRIGLNIGDLDIIRGAEEAGADRIDVIALSGLNDNLYKTLDRFNGETSGYKSVVENSAGADVSLRGNLDVNGAIAASSIRYYKLDSVDDASNLIDISTSRTSAWSTFTPIGSEPSTSDPIFYGAQVKINTGGEVTANKLICGEVAQPLVFPEAEVPTHKITTSINGEVVKLYAMKSIPLKFTGFFRNFDGIVAINAIPNRNVGWRIVNLTNSADETRIKNTSISYRSVSASPRRVEIYYPPNNFTSITLTSIGMSKLPLAELPNLNSLNISFNEFKDMPNIIEFAPSLQILNIFRNNLYLAEAANLRKLNIDVVNKLPSTSLTSLSMYGTYYGSIRCVDRSTQDGSGTIVGSEITTGIGESDSTGPISMSVIEARFPYLELLNINRGNTGGPFFGPDDYDPLCYLPSVSQTCEEYYAGNNDFRRIPSTGVNDLIALKHLNLVNNVNLLDTSFSLASFQLVSVAIDNTSLSIPNLSSRTLLTSFSYSHGRIANSLFSGSTEGSYKFSSCTNLESLGFYSSAVTGFIPRFRGNINLKSVDLYNTNGITGGRPTGTDYVLYKDTFADCRGISFFRVQSSGLLEGKGFEEGTFTNLSSLYYLHWVSYGRTGNTIPDLASCSSLQYVIMPLNNFSESIPPFASNDNLFYVDFSQNALVGAVPSFDNKQRLQYVFLNNNKLTSFNGFISTTQLLFAYLQNNLIGGVIPMMSGQTTNLIRLYLNNNLFVGYTAGSFAEITRIQIIDLSNNNLSETDLNNIIDDLFLNYTAAPRSRVSVNLRSQSRAVGYNPSAEGSDRERDIREKLNLLASKGWSIAIGG